MNNIKMIRKNISTHTLTWSVTSIGGHSEVIDGISTHTLTWSVTGEMIMAKAIDIFQLTRSRGA